MMVALFSLAVILSSPAPTVSEIVAGLQSGNRRSIQQALEAAERAPADIDLLPPIVTLIEGNDAGLRDAALKVFASHCIGWYEQTDWLATRFLADADERRALVDSAQHYDKRVVAALTTEVKSGSETRFWNAIDIWAGLIEISEPSGFCGSVARTSFKDFFHLFRQGLWKLGKSNPELIRPLLDSNDHKLKDVAAYIFNSSDPALKGAVLRWHQSDDVLDVRRAAINDEDLHRSGRYKQIARYPDAEVAYRVWVSGSNDLKGFAEEILQDFDSLPPLAQAAFLTSEQLVEIDAERYRVNPKDWELKVRELADSSLASSFSELRESALVFTVRSRIYDDLESWWQSYNAVCLGDPEPRIRHFGLELARLLPPDKAIKAFARLVMDPEEQVRRFAMNELMKADDITAWANALPFFQLQVLGKAADPLDEFHELLRWRIGDDRKAVLALAEDEEPELRSAVLYALLYVGATEAEEHLVRREFAGPNAEVAVMIACRAKFKGITQEVKAALKTANRFELLGIIEALGKWGNSADAVPILRELQDSGPYQVRLAAGRALEAYAST